MDPDIVYPTGRLVFPKAELGVEVAKALQRDGTITIVVGNVDFTVIEQYILATMFFEAGTGNLVIDIESPGGGIPGPGYMANGKSTMDRRYWPMFKQSGGQIAQALERKPAIKQNGRSAAYLAHDPTKNRRRPRRG